MDSMVNLPCWQITRCGSHRFNCSVYKNPDIPCWEQVKLQNDYRKFNHICSDCIVYIMKTCPSYLSADEIDSILTQRGINLYRAEAC